MDWTSGKISLFMKIFFMELTWKKKYEKRLTLELKLDEAADQDF